MASEKKWHPKFIEYMEKIVNNPNYKGIPYKRNNKGQIAWIAPKVGEIGKKRIKWVLEKAKSLSYPNIAGVYARVMFHIHPTKEKPCQICGRTMSLRYIYLNNVLIKALNKIGFTFTELNTIGEVCEEIEKKYNRIFLISFIENKFKIPVEAEESIESIVNRCEELCRTGGSKMLGPGAMSNFPDRLDGFHTYNRCCRKKEDTGRHDDNMRTYNKDRRAYEYWSDGNIYAANKFMHSSFFDGHSADHIGPISLGFKHDSLLLQKMTSGDNSAKRDRLLLSDIKKLIKIEKDNADYICASWFICKIWEEIKRNISSMKQDVLNKYRDILKQNMFLFMRLLQCIKKSRNGEDFLVSMLLKPKYDCFNYEYTFGDYGQIVSQTLKNKTDATKNEYDRFERIALTSIDEYIKKNNRRINIQFTDKEQKSIKSIISLLDGKKYDKALEMLYSLVEGIQIRLCCK